ncbi:hypothetical protein TRM7557_01873 [Tritonibacter multivorans]|uniref:Tat pathway signal sequence domain protein n=1 Tax=Tritonibacter multivorans TaxID=928856 RepID=A0A0P1GA87_9RHOB|nr:hypothetical protein [Tritonibacter multivorans]MDA7422122.1 hypothetical protein [Tritonibacter multivorans]CUH78423.1 hypothetical protein TRM7557_01873 [Tritonibacter multivorans]SFD16639.1 hypothetical protein SAMN04488049_10844 [Tritonibacter multivorans]
MISFKPVAAALLCAVFSATTAATEEQFAHISLNSTEPQAEACRLVLTAKAPEDIKSLVVETVLFDRSDRVMLLTLFDFAALPAGKLRVRQFDIPNTRCGDVSRVLFNGIDSCEGPGCDAPLRATSAVADLEVLG